MLTANTVSPSITTTETPVRRSNVTVEDEVNESTPFEFQYPKVENSSSSSSPSPSGSSSSETSENETKADSSPSPLNLSPNSATIKAKKQQIKENDPLTSILDYLSESELPSASNTCDTLFNMVKSKVSEKCPNEYKDISEMVLNSIYNSTRSNITNAVSSIVQAVAAPANTRPIDLVRVSPIPPAPEEKSHVEQAKEETSKPNGVSESKCPLEDEDGDDGNRYTLSPEHIERMNQLIREKINSINLGGGVSFIVQNKNGDCEDEKHNRQPSPGEDQLRGRICRNAVSNLANRTEESHDKQRQSTFWGFLKEVDNRQSCPNEDQPQGRTWRDAVSDLANRVEELHDKERPIEFSSPDSSQPRRETMWDFFSELANKAKELDDNERLYGVKSIPSPYNSQPSSESSSLNSSFRDDERADQNWKVKLAEVVVRLYPHMKDACKRQFDSFSFGSCNRSSVGQARQVEDLELLKKSVKELQSRVQFLTAEHFHRVPAAKTTPAVVIRKISIPVKASSRYISFDRPIQMRNSAQVKQSTNKMYFNQQTNAGQKISLIPIPTIVNYNDLDIYVDQTNKKVVICFPKSKYAMFEKNTYTVPLQKQKGKKHIQVAFDFDKLSHTVRVFQY